MAHGDKSRQREALLVALMSCPTVSQAAQQAGLSKSTALRWLTEPAFRQRYDDVRRQALEETLHYLQRSMLAAAAKLNALLLDRDSRPMVQLGAARAILEYGLRAVEMQEFSARLAALEQQLLLTKGHP
jgi:hypothetical protein